MNYTIRNNNLTVTTSSLGGELQSVLGKDGTEYLWQGDINTWNYKALNIFPYVARLTKGQYIFEGNTYYMDIHGFAYSLEFEVENRTSDSISFVLHHNEETMKQYPFLFTYKIHEKLVENTLEITYEVINNDNKTMYFGLGGHPGFNVPAEDGLKFEDYYLEFKECKTPYRVGMSDTCFVEGEDTPYMMRDGKYIDLKHNLFDDDAIILRDVSREVTLKSHNGRKSITVSYPDMDYLGLWHWPKIEIPYICIEPWTSLPSRQDIIEDISKQPNLISLKPKESYRNKWSISIND
ncbi:aldose 1-epimerase family protein [Clostridium sp. BSD9I1]|uniref:aldose 1-epimerase family protein n=1 Tax=Clostridium sp. BSD9I1 TaxID=2003589 RepID=UPI00164737A1|nr:aldose 1-epimerase family protein [Clostridium sp. BSD9I1]